MARKLKLIQVFGAFAVSIFLLTLFVLRKGVPSANPRSNIPSSRIVDAATCRNLRLPVGYTTAEMKKLVTFNREKRAENGPDATNGPLNASWASIVFVTKRPGGYDVFLNSLAEQTNKNFEIICIDELAAVRGEDIVKYAHKIGLKNIMVMPGKPPNPAYANYKFRIANALNTGFLFTGAPIIMVVMDYAWVPKNYVERTLQFYQQGKHRQNHLLAYPETHFGAPDHVGKLVDGWTHDSKLLTIFKRPMCKPPNLKLEGMSWGGFFSRPEEIFKEVGMHHEYEKQNPPWFWELSAATGPWSLLGPLNGVDERLDVGDDCHEANMRQRAEVVWGSETWTDTEIIVQQLFHRFQEDKDMWSRDAKDTNLFGLHGQLVKDVADKKSPAAAPNDFNLVKWRMDECVEWAVNEQLDTVQLGETSMKTCNEIYNTS